jgi:hypothetical protein
LRRDVRVTAGMRCRSLVPKDFSPWCAASTAIICLIDHHRYCSTIATAAINHHQPRSQTIARRSTQSRTPQLPSTRFMAASTRMPSRSWLRCSLFYDHHSTNHHHCHHHRHHQVHAPLFAYHFWNSTSALDCTPANRSTVTEQTLADPLVSLLEHGSLRDDVQGVSQHPKIKYAGALIGERTACLPGTKCRCPAAAVATAAAAAAAHSLSRLQGCCLQWGACHHVRL